MMCLILKAILYPGAHLAVTTGGKEQASSITTAKIDEICSLIPALSNEIDWSRGATKHSKDAVEYKFKNGSVIDILAAKESSRGQRRHGIVIEECILVDPDMLNEVVLPTTVVDRNLPDGTRDHDEVINQSQTYITTAGYKNSFAYEKLIELMIQSLIDPKNVMILGGSYLTPIAEGQLPEDFVQDQKLSGTYKEESFGREYGSIWAGDAENAFFSNEKFEKNRELIQAEYEHSGRASKNAYYVVSVDVGRYKCTTEACVFKITPQPNKSSAIKSLVNIYTYEAENLRYQAIKLKKLFFQYKARTIVIDTNGVGAGLLDEMVLTQVDPETGDEMPSFGLINDINNNYKDFNRQAMVRDAIFQVKATAPAYTEMYVYTQSQIGNGKVKFLIDEATAKAKLLSTKVGQNMEPDQRNDYLRPYIQTSILREQMANLVEEHEGINIKLTQATKSIPKDKFSAFVYGMFYIKQEENKKQKRFDVKDLCLFN